MRKTTLEQLDHIQEFIQAKLDEGISCARKTVKGKLVELIYHDRDDCCTVYYGGSEQHFATLKKACEHYDSIK